MYIHVKNKARNAVKKTCICPMMLPPYMGSSMKLGPLGVLGKHRYLLQPSQCPQVLMLASQVLFLSEWSHWPRNSFWYSLKVCISLMPCFLSQEPLYHWKEYFTRFSRCSLVCRVLILAFLKPCFPSTQDVQNWRIRSSRSSSLTLYIARSSPFRI